MHRFDNSSGPYPYVGSTYHMAPIQSSPRITHSHTRFHQYHGASQPISSPSPPIIRDLSLSPHLISHSPSQSHATSPKIITEPEASTRALANAPPLFESMESEIRGYIDKKDVASPLEFEGLSWDQFQEFREKAKMSLPGWNKLNVDYLSHLEKCIIQCTGPGHEIMGNVLMQFWATLADSSAHMQVVRNIVPMGTAEMDLQDGAKKQPDYSFVDDNRDLLPEEQTFPTTIFEVAYKETSRKVAVDCGRFIACSLGRGQLAVAIDIKEDSDNELATIRCAKWELDSIETINTWPPRKGDKYYSRDLDRLYRSDNYAADEERELVCPPATSFYCISRIGEGNDQAVYAFHAEESESFLIYPVDATATSGLKILYRHIYREPADSMADEVLYDIPRSLLLKVIQRHVDIDHGRKQVVKRKHTSIGLRNILAVVNKRKKKMENAETEKESSGSKSTGTNL